jgi:hypothetical protein
MFQIEPLRKMQYVGPRHPRLTVVSKKKNNYGIFSVHSVLSSSSSPSSCMYSHPHNYTQLIMMQPEVLILIATNLSADNFAAQIF